MQYLHTHVCCGPHDKPRKSNDCFRKPNRCFGIEITDQRLADFCELGNLDPQHTRPMFFNDGPYLLTASELALTCDLPPPGCHIIIADIDVDAILAASILEIRARGARINARRLQNWVDMVAGVDGFRNGHWSSDSVYDALKNMNPGWRILTEFIRYYQFQPMKELVSAIIDQISNHDCPKPYIGEVHRIKDPKTVLAVEGMPAVAVFIDDPDERNRRYGIYARAPIAIRARQTWCKVCRTHVLGFAIGSFHPSYIDFEAMNKKLRREYDETWTGSNSYVISPHETCMVLREVIEGVTPYVDVAAIKRLHQHDSNLVAA